MKKAVLRAWESNDYLKAGNHAVAIKPRPLPTTIISDATLEAETFDATRVFYYHEHPVCVVNDNDKTFRLSHAGIYATDTATGEVKEGEWPKTCTQTLMMYRDLACGEGYTELHKIEGRPARDWKAHMEQYQKEKAMRKAGIIPPRKSRAKKAKVNEAMLELLEKEFGLSREQVLAKMAEKAEPAAPNLPMCLPVYQMTAEQVHAYFTRRNIERIPYATVVKGTTDEKGTVQAIFRWEFEYLKHHDHAEAEWWEANIKDEPAEQNDNENVVVIDADYIEKLQAEAREIGKKNPSKKTKKATTKKTTAKKATTKKTTAKKTTKKVTKKEAVA